MPEAMGSGRPSLEIETKLYRGLADPSRLAILRELRRGPLTAGQLARICRLSSPRASNHLGCLLECGLLAVRPRGRYNVYELAHPAIGRLLDTSAVVLTEVGPLIEACLHYGSPSRRSLRAKPAMRAAPTLSNRVAAAVAGRQGRTTEDDR